MLWKSAFWSGISPKISYFLSPWEPQLKFSTLTSCNNRALVSSGANLVATLSPKTVFSNLFPMQMPWWKVWHLLKVSQGQIKDPCVPYFSLLQPSPFYVNPGPHPWSFLYHPGFIFSFLSLSPPDPSTGMSNLLSFVMQSKFLLL